VVCRAAVGLSTEGPEGLSRAFDAKNRGCAARGSLGLSRKNLIRNRFSSN
jgi:hypothetical protein